MRFRSPYAGRLAAPLAVNQHSKGEMRSASLVLVSIGSLIVALIGLHLSGQHCRRDPPHPSACAKGVRGSGQDLPDVERQVQLVWG